MLECTENGYNYFGETKNLKARFLSTYSSLKRGVHASKKCQEDWNLYGSSKFCFKVLYMNDALIKKKIIRKMEAILVRNNISNVYNKISNYPLISLEESTSFLNNFNLINKVIPWPLMKGKG